MRNYYQVLPAVFSDCRTSGILSEPSHQLLVPASLRLEAVLRIATLNLILAAKTYRHAMVQYTCGMCRAYRTTLWRGTICANVLMVAPADKMSIPLHFHRLAVSAGLGMTVRPAIHTSGYKNAIIFVCSHLNLFI